MPREIAVFDLLMPTLLLLFVATALAQWWIDAALGRLGVYRQVWHAPLFRLSLFMCLFGGMALLIY